MKKLTQALLFAGVIAAPAALVSAPVMAADAAPYTLTSNVSLVSDYYFRGQSQTWNEPALQGGMDFSHQSGFYAGLWGSSVSGKWINESSLELDYYAGYNGKITDDFGYTAGIYGYYYPGANYDGNNSGLPSQKYDTLEWNVGLSYKMLSVKYSQTVGDWFGVNDKTFATLDRGNTKGSSYLEANASFEIAPSWTLGLHVGRTNIKGNWTGANGSTNPDFTDYKVAVTKSFDGGWNVGVAYVDSTNDSFWTTTAWGSTDTINPNKSAWILSAGRVF